MLPEMTPDPTGGELGSSRPQVVVAEALRTKGLVVNVDEAGCGAFLAQQGMPSDRIKDLTIQVASCRTLPGTEHGCLPGYGRASLQGDKVFLYLGSDAVRLERSLTVAEQSFNRAILPGGDVRGQLRDGLLSLRDELRTRGFPGWAAYCESQAERLDSSEERVRARRVSSGLAGIEEVLNLLADPEVAAGDKLTFLRHMLVAGMEEYADRTLRHELVHAAQVPKKSRCPWQIKAGLPLARDAGFMAAVAGLLHGRALEAAWAAGRIGEAGIVFSMVAAYLPAIIAMYTSHPFETEARLTARLTQPEAREDRLVRISLVSETG